MRIINIVFAGLLLAGTECECAGRQTPIMKAGLPEGLGVECTNDSGFAFSAEQAQSGFIVDFQRWAKDDAVTGMDADSVLCVGSSSMRLWGTIEQDLAPLRVIHRGFGGSTLKDVLDFQNFFSRYPCRTVVIYEGDNDLMGACTPEQFIEQCHRFVAVMQSSGRERTFYFLSIKPSLSRWSKWETFARANTLLKAYCDATDGLFYVDVATPMLGPDGRPQPELFAEDHLHMTAAGYQVWKQAVRKALFGE